MIDRKELKRLADQIDNIPQYIKYQMDIQLLLDLEKIYRLLIELQNEEDDLK